jgi:D-specific alpha-keto acid dehydrogenase
MPVPITLPVYGCELDESRVFRARAPYFGITPVITSAPVRASTARLAAGRCSVSVGHKTPIGEPELRALADAGVRYISTRSAGVDHIDLLSACELGITVENVAYSPDSVADHTLMLMLMALRRTKAVLRGVDAHDYRLPDDRGRELRDLTVGIIGTGRIGTAVIERLHGFGCRILACDEGRSADAEYVALDDLLRASDIVSLHVPLDAGTRHLLDARRLGSMKPGAYVVNTGRGGLIDTAALVDALADGRLGGAALDVVEGEEGVFYADRRTTPVTDETLLRLHALPNALLTPHTGYYTDHALTDTVINSLINCLRFERGLQRD